MPNLALKQGPARAPAGLACPRPRSGPRQQLEVSRRCWTEALRILLNLVHRVAEPTATEDTTLNLRRIKTKIHQYSRTDDPTKRIAVPKASLRVHCLLCAAV